MQLNRLFDFVEYQLQHHPQEKAICDLFQGQFRSYSTQEMSDISNQIARGLLATGLKPNDSVGIVAYRNRVEFTLLDLGIQKAGLVSVPLYPTISAREYEYILNDASCKAVFYGSGDLAQKIVKAQENAPSLKALYALDEGGDHVHWKSIWEGESSSPIGKDIPAEDVATIIYTSGTTGHPKGVMLTHTNIVANVKAVYELFPFSAGQRVMSFLPLCHVFERTGSYAFIYKCASITYTALDNLGGPNGDLQKVKPHFMNSVPRLLEKIYEKIYQKGLELTGIKKKLFFWAMDLAEDYEYDKTYTGLDKIKRNIADKLIFSKWRAALGGHVVGIVTGSAPCPVRIARIFSAAGIPIREGYGLTESSPGITINGFVKGYAKLGTVGPALDGVEIRIDERDGVYQKGEGEIIASGKNIMKGYHNKPEETAKVLREIDGKIWLYTGDIGKIVTGENGVEFLKITDRKKELLKTSGGKYVAPAPIENKLREDIIVEQVMVIGDGKKFVSAIITVAEEPLKLYCKHKNISWTSANEMVDHPDVIAKYDRIISEMNPGFSKVEQIKKFKLLADNWVPIKEDGSAGELTPTLKLKRRVLREKYKDIIDDLYAG